MERSGQAAELQARKGPSQQPDGKAGQTVQNARDLKPGDLSRAACPGQTGLFLGALLWLGW